MARADLRKPETRDIRAEIGRCVEAARLAAGWNLDEFAQQCGGRDPRQVQRWCKGDERDRPQFDVLFAINDPRFQEALIVGLARVGRRARISTRIEFDAVENQVA